MKGVYRSFYTQLLLTWLERSFCPSLSSFVCWTGSAHQLETRTKRRNCSILCPKCNFKTNSAILYFLTYLESQEVFYTEHFDQGSKISTFPKKLSTLLIVTLRPTFEQVLAWEKLPAEERAVLQAERQVFVDLCYDKKPWSCWEHIY